uniref:C2H2-type domain-containing protein n=1 Tax=Acanthochromis polyacanthus TaxID=80966 RepID=A0A3Q1FM36_9TELE
SELILICSLFKHLAVVVPLFSYLVLNVQLLQTSNTDGTDAGTSAALIKTEDGGEDCGGTEPNNHFDPSAGLEADSGDYWREFNCKVCGESFQRMSYLLNHSAAHLRDCGICGKHLERTDNLKLHLKVHRESSFRCSVCGQSFTLRGNLRTHMRIHSGERPYACTVCGKSFGRRATLVRHVRSHTGEKPFTCTYCGHGFVEKGNLTVHLRTHTGERPYWCSVCDRRFSQLSCFYKHPCQRRGLISAPVNPS